MRLALDPCVVGDWLIVRPLRARFAGPAPQGGQVDSGTAGRRLGHCTRSLVVGHYQPLADNRGIAPQPDQTGPLQSDQRTLQSQNGFALLSL